VVRIVPTRGGRLGVDGRPADPDGPTVSIGAAESSAARCRTRHVAAPEPAALRA
jgi:thymidine kinase